MSQDLLRKLEADLWRAANSLRANSELRASEYATPGAGPCTAGAQVGGMKRGFGA